MPRYVLGLFALLLAFGPTRSDARDIGLTQLALEAAPAVRFKRLVTAEGLSENSTY